MTIRLVLIAHAPTEATRQARFPDDEPLDTHGSAAATAVTATILGRTDQAVRGPERRCLQTAEALGLRETVALPVLADLDVAKWRGRSLTDLADELPGWLADPAATPHGGEALHQLIERVAGWLDDLPESPARIVAVTHPAVIRAAVLHTLGAPAAAFWRIDVTPLSLTLLSRHAARWQLRETGHPLS
jgi:broad specificity phosphatase PhoE